jgi:cystathionine beta-lyase/cystathionine gamma-synthase
VIDPTLPYAETLRRRADAITTTCVHAGESPDSDGALDPAIVMSSAFAFTSAEQAARAFKGDEDAWIYGRWGNPTVGALERKLAALEGAEAACATSSGMAAIAGVLLASCEAGDHVVAPRSMYAESARLLRERLPRLGITTTFVSGTPEAYAAAVTDQTRLLYVETPSNPTLGVIDIAGIAELARSITAGPRGRPRLLVDGTFATPFAQCPLALGADLVVHSMTKGISGHGDVIGGAVMGSRELVDGAFPDIVLEVIEASPMLDTLAVYDGFAVPEVWIFEGGAFTIHCWKASSGYVRKAKSALLPELDFDLLTKLTAMKSQQAALESLEKAVRGAPATTTKPKPRRS